MPIGLEVCYLTLMPWRMISDNNLAYPFPNDEVIILEHLVS